MRQVNPTKEDIVDLINKYISQSINYEESERLGKYLLERALKYAAAIRRRYPFVRIEIEDIASEALVKVFNNFEKIDIFCGNPDAWLYKIIQNCIYDNFRRKKVEPMDPNVMKFIEEMGVIRAWIGMDEELGDSEQIAMENEKRRILAECINQLREKDRQILQLHFASLSAKEISEKLCIASANAVNTALSKIRRQLRECVKKRVGQP